MNQLGIVPTVQLLIAASLVACGGERTPDKCAPDESFCDGSTRFYCVDRHTETKYISSEECGRDEVCVMAHFGQFSVPMCALHEVPDVRCPDGNYKSFCDGNLLTGCSWGYVTDVWDCGERTCLQNPGKPDDADCADPEDPCYQLKDGWSCATDYEAFRCSGQHEYDRVACQGCETALADPSVNLTDFGVPPTCQ